MPGSTIGPGATGDYFPVVYQELKRIARQHLRAAGGESTLSTTEVVHEAFLKLTGGREVDWDSRAHFFGSAARAMRQVLIDFARRRRATKRGGAWRTVSLRDEDPVVEVQLDELLALHEALDRLDAVDERLRRVVELRFFDGVSGEDIARMFRVSARTVERDWLKAKLFLLGVLEERSPSKAGES